MASTVLTLTLEMDVIHDAIEEVQRVHQRLASCHGDDYRKLDRAIERLMDEMEDAFDIHSIGGGKMVAAPAGLLTDILGEAYRLGLTR